MVYECGCAYGCLGRDGDAGAVAAGFIIVVLCGCADIIAGAVDGAHSGGCARVRVTLYVSGDVQQKNGASANCNPYVSEGADLLFASKVKSLGIQI